MPVPHWNVRRISRVINVPSAMQKLLTKRPEVDIIHSMHTKKELKAKAKLVSAGDRVNQSQESSSDQLADLVILANMFGLYDAADYLREHLVMPADNT